MQGGHQLGMAAQNSVTEFSQPCASNQTRRRRRHHLYHCIDSIKRQKKSFSQHQALKTLHMFVQFTTTRLASFVVSKHFCSRRQRKFSLVKSPIAAHFENGRYVYNTCCMWILITAVSRLMHGRCLWQRRNHGLLT